MNNKLNIKIAFFDIDGTLINSNKEITNNTITTLNNLYSRGIEIVLCSGRPNSYIINLSKKIYGIRYSISSNGAEIYDMHTKKNIYDSKINFNYISSIWNYCINNKLAIIINTKYEKYTNKFINNIKDYIILENIKTIKKKNIYQIVINFNNYEEMNKLKEFITNNSSLKIINCSLDYLNKNIYGYHWFDIVNNDVSKGKAIKKLLSKLNIDKNNAICFGDSINDIEMFNECGIKVAMGNALDELKNIADYITDTNNSDGISKFFDKYL